MLQDNTICQIPDPKVILTPDVCGNAFFNVTYIMKHISDKGWVSLSVLHQRVATYSETPTQIITVFNVFVAGVHLQK